MRKGKISIKAIVILCAIQFIIIALFLLTCYQRQSVDKHNTNTETILVENTDYIGQVGRHSEFYVYSNSNRYEWEIKISQLKGYNSRNLANLCTWYSDFKAICENYYVDFYICDFI